MKIKEGLVIRKIANEHIIIPAGERVIDFNGLIRLNDTAVFLWNLLIKGCTTNELITGLTDEYEIDSETAADDIHSLLEKLKQNNFLENE